MRMYLNSALSVSIVLRRTVYFFWIWLRINGGGGELEMQEMPRPAPSDSMKSALVPMVRMGGATGAPRGRLGGRHVAFSGRLVGRLVGRLEGRHGGAPGAL